MPAKRSAPRPYVIVRTYSAGVHAGELVSRRGREIVLANARRIWYWSGAATLSELSQRGVKNPTKCKIPLAIPEILLTEAIEILQCTAAARASIEGVPEWTA